MANVSIVELRKMSMIVGQNLKLTLINLSTT